MNLPSEIIITDVGPRDGLQTLAERVPASVKVKLINKLIDAGLPEIEVGSFVSPKAVPQMADTGEVFAAIKRDPGCVLSALVPNRRGLDAALEAKVDKVAIFASVTETFSQKNTGGSIEEVHERLAEVARETKAVGLPLRGYLSCVFDCPFEGRVFLGDVTDAAERLLELEIDELDLGDTLGTAGPTEVVELLEAITEIVPIEKVVMHFHDTFGRGIASAWEAMRCGVTRFDSSCGGVGGCPFAPGATGNVATEDLVALAERCDVMTGVDLDAVVDAATLLRPFGASPTRAGSAYLAASARMADRNAR